MIGVKRVALRAQHATRQLPVGRKHKLESVVGRPPARRVARVFTTELVLALRVRTTAVSVPQTRAPLTYIASPALPQLSNCTVASSRENSSLNEFCEGLDFSSRVFSPWAIL